MDDGSSTSVFVGNLRRNGRIGELKTHLLALFHKVLRIQVSQSDISIINGAKKYAIVDVHQNQNVDYALENLSEYEDRRKLKFDFLTIVDKGVQLHVDRMKSRDEKQARDDFENSKNAKKTFGYQIPHRPTRTISRQDVNAVRQKSLKSMSSRSVAPKSSITGRSMSRSSMSTTRGDNPIHSQSSIHYISTDLDVTLDDTILESGREKKIHIVPVPPTKEESDDSGRQSQNSESRYDVQRNLETATEMSDGSLESDAPEYEDPPGSVIDLRNVQRKSMKAGHIGPRVRRTPMYDIPAKSSTSREDFFSFLDHKVSDARTPLPETHRNKTSTPHNFAEGGHALKIAAPESEEEVENYAYFKLQERIFNEDGKREFKAVEGPHNLKLLREHVGKCVSGFLNSGQHGILLIGVESDGTVVGIECDPQQQERYERHFVEAIKEIYPPIYSDDYSISFLPIIENNGRQHANLKVIEIRTGLPENNDLLFECREGVFVRRNNVLTGPIKPSHIQEWVRVKHFGEVADMRKQEGLIKDEMEKKDLLIRKQADTINAQKSQLESQQRRLESKGCVIL